MAVITVTIKVNARQERVEQTGPSEYRVAVNAPPIEGRANARLIALLAEFFDLPKSSITLRSGATSKRKRVEIPDHCSTG